MKITTIIPEDLYEGSMELILETQEGEKSISIGSGESEDMSLARDLNCVLFIDELLIMAYNAGKNGEEVDVKRIKEDENE